MKRLATFWLMLLMFGSSALSQDQPGAPDRAPLLLVQQIPLPNVGGRIDHFTFDGKRKRVIGAALGNNTVEVVDTFAGCDIHSNPARRGGRFETIGTIPTREGEGTSLLISGPQSSLRCPSREP